MRADLGDNNIFKSLFQFAASRLGPQEWEFWWRLSTARRCYKRGEKKEGSQRHRAAYAIANSEERRLRRLLDQLVETKEPELAVDVCRRLLALDPDRIEFLAAFGKLLSDLGRHDEACACFERAVELDPKDPAARFGLGAVRQQQGHLVQAQSHFEKAMMLDPDHKKARQALAELTSTPGTAASDEMNSVTAAAGLVAAIIKEGKSEDGHWTGGLNGHLALNRLLLGRPAYHKAIAVTLAQEAALIRKFETIRHIINDYESMSPQLKGEIAYGPVIERELERWQEQGSAVQLYRLSTQFDPGAGLVEYSLGAALSSGGGEEEPGAHFRNAAKLATELEPYVELRDAAAYEGKGAHKDASRLYQKAAERLTSLGRLHETVASCLRKSEKVEAALDHYEKAISCTRFFPPEFWAPDSELADCGREYLWRFNRTKMPDVNA